MRIFIDTTIHIYHYAYRREPKKYRYSKLENVSVVFFDGDLYGQISKKLKELATDLSTLSKPIKIYFDPSCKYPRYKIKDNSDFKRVIKQEKSDVAVFSSINKKIG